MAPPVNTVGLIALLLLTMLTVPSYADLERDISDCVATCILKTMACSLRCLSKGDRAQRCIMRCGDKAMRCANRCISFRLDINHEEQCGVFL
jgi:hypothetical protein